MSEAEHEIAVLKATVRVAESDFERIAAQLLRKTQQLVDAINERDASLAREGEMRRDTLEEAAKLAEEFYDNSVLTGSWLPPMQKKIAAAIRALASHAPSSGEEKSHGSSAALPQSSAKCAEAGKGV